ncbi:VrrA/YqfQ family protein [Niallia sp. 03133]|uniref:VrrA/YqfQ family protein n=1 Tax=Niallia sp. 03133 TaxID=3458060 RepID=UPI004043D6DB
MPPRLRNPYQRGMMGGRMIQQGPPNFPNPMMGRGGAPARSGGGILAKLLGRGNSGASNATRNVANAGARSAAGSGGGILKAISNPASINGFLANSQKFLNTASQLGPMINQYGPMVRNIPAMWKLYRGLKNFSSSEEETSVAEDAPTKKNKNTITKNTSSTSKKISGESTEVDEWETEDDSEISKGPSVPKLYI